MTSSRSEVPRDPDASQAQRPPDGPTSGAPRARDSDPSAAESEAKLRAIIDYGPDAVLGVDDQGRIVLVNVMAERMFGYAREELLGQPIEITVPERLHEAHHQYRRRFMQAPGARAMGSGLQLSARRKDGSEFPVEISLGTAHLQEGAMVMASVRDITARKLAEQRETTMLRSLAAIGESSALLAHEIKNPLTAVNAALKAMATKLGVEEREILSDLVDRLRRVEMMMRRTLSFTKPLDIRKSMVRIADLISGAIADTSSVRAATTIGMDVLIVPPDLEVDVEPQLIREVLVNLVTNAVEALGSTGEIHIRARATAERVELEVEDNGPGIPEVIRNAAFKPFTTTKPTGTGMGLAISRKIIEQHGGTIEFRDVAPHGSCAVIRLPKMVRTLPAR